MPAWEATGYFEVCFCVLNFMLIGHYTINIPEIFPIRVRKLSESSFSLGLLYRKEWTGIWFTQFSNPSPWKSNKLSQKPWTRPWIACFIPQCEITFLFLVTRDFGDRREPWFLIITQMNEESWMRGQQTCPFTIHYNMWTVSSDVSITCICDTRIGCLIHSELWFFFMLF